MIAVTIISLLTHKGPSSDIRVSSIKAIKKELSEEFIIPDKKCLGRIKSRCLITESEDKEKIIGYSISSEEDYGNWTLHARVYSTKIRYGTKHGNGYNYDDTGFETEAKKYKDIDVEINRLRSKPDPNFAPGWSIETYCYFKIDGCYYEVSGRTFLTDEYLTIYASREVDGFVEDIYRSIIDQSE